MKVWSLSCIAFHRRFKQVPCQTESLCGIYATEEQVDKEIKLYKENLFLLPDDSEFHMWVVRDWDIETGSFYEYRCLDIDGTPITEIRLPFIEPRKIPFLEPIVVKSRIESEKEE